MLCTALLIIKDNKEIIIKEVFIMLGKNGLKTYHVVEDENSFFGFTTNAYRGGDEKGACLPLSGGTMLGGIDMGQNVISNLADGENPNDAATKGYVDARTAAIQTDGEWKYKVYADGTFEAWNRQTEINYAITTPSGSLFRSIQLSFAAPQALSNVYDVNILDARVQVGHGSYPVFCSDPTYSETDVRFYVLSGEERSLSNGYTVSFYMFGTLTPKPNE